MINNTGKDFENPYAHVVEWINRHEGTGSANGLAKLILSLWSEDAAFSFRECISSFDDTRLAWAEEMTTHFIRFRFDRFLEDAAKQVALICPHLIEKGLAGCHAKCDWERSKTTVKKH
ncbi:conserved hypothetical protein [Desulfosarcina cetonica]|uniref:hypothetical protein n=1 Tax=Desulfosarcina cetonica TaxID=90730 RepID=UPI0006D0D90A|nr:hypothetical protein [Desulfosarcina cetonica]VTR71332.1 conserved hypothetical protein [Desulfosarcina cetonica]